VLVSDDDESGAPYASGYSMSTALKMAEGCPTLKNIQSIAEGRGGVGAEMSVHPGCLMAENNLLGRRLSELCCTLADRGFFSDERNRVKYGREIPNFAAAATMVQ